MSISTPIKIAAAQAGAEICAAGGSAEALANLMSRQRSVSAVLGPLVEEEPIQILGQNPASMMMRIPRHAP